LCADGKCWPRLHLFRAWPKNYCRRTRPVVRRCYFIIFGAPLSWCTGNNSWARPGRDTVGCSVGTPLPWCAGSNLRTISPALIASHPHLTLPLLLPHTQSDPSPNSAHFFSISTHNLANLTK
jgi:hypothetical protein